MKSARFVIPLLVVLLTACASRPARVPVPAQAVAGSSSPKQASREATLRDWPFWRFNGRLAVNNAGKGGSGSVEWKQEGRGDYVITLRAPVTRQSWKLIHESFVSNSVKLEGLAGGTREGEDAAALLQEATGWRIPVVSLGDWAQGMPSSAGAPAQISFDGEGRPLRIEQDGWVIDYLDWQAATGDAPELPRRIEAKNGDAKIRMVIDEWSIDRRPSHRD